MCATKLCALNVGVLSFQAGSRSLASESNSSYKAGTSFKPVAPELLKRLRGK